MISTSVTQSSRQAAVPKLLTAFGDALRQPDLRGKLLFTLALLIVFRFFAHVPIPGIDLDALNRLLQGNQLFGFFDLFSGGAFRNLSVASMGVYPYITASIIIQLMIPVIPRLQALAKEGEQGRQRINQITHWLTVPMAILQAFGQLVLFERAGVIPNVGLGGGEVVDTMAMVLSMTAATMFLVWLGELITEHGIGNGISMIIFGGIVAGLPGAVRSGFVNVDDMAGLLLFIVMGLGIIFLIVYFTEAVRKVPVEYGRTLFRGGRMYRQGGSTHIPLRVNSAGMIPLIFAIAVLILPPTIASYFLGSDTGWVNSVATFFRDFFDTRRFIYWLFYFILVVGFTFFYTLVIFQQQNLAETLQKNGGFIPGIRPGRPTEEFLNRVILRITWGGALFLGLVAVAPYVVSKLTGTNVGILPLQSTALLIVVGVVLDTMRQLEAQLLMRRYEGFIR
ncbi:MAG: preprotein translocase subunit SecY [Chloroflexi bacterium]|nr:preprotein translocase subunit SecY [Chloroflexota bacterium]